MKFSREILPFCKTIEMPYLNSQFVLNNQKIGKPVPIPLPVIGDKIYAPNRYIRGLIFFHVLRCKRLSSNFDANDLVYVPPPFNIKIFFHWLDVLANELPIWKKHYAPPFGMKDFTVLDAGAGCGETAWLFLGMGAKKVICIEPDPNRFNLILDNAAANRWNIEAINDYLRPEHVERPDIDFAKIDIEGGEWFIKDLKLPPSVLETHNDQTREAFEQRGFWTVMNNHRGCALVRNC